MYRFGSFLLMVATLIMSQVSHASTWDIDPAHTNAQFAVQHLMVSTVRGNFTKVSGTVHLDDQDPTQSTIQATLDAASLNTRVDKRDQHLKSPDFFDVAKYPPSRLPQRRFKKSAMGSFRSPKISRFTASPRKSC